MSDNIKTFLAKVMPEFPQGQQAFINIHWAVESDRQGQNKRWTGRACTSIDEAVKTVNWIKNQGKPDIYVCMSLQARAAPKTSAKGFTYLEAIRFTESVVSIRSLFIDVDVKEKAYPSTKLALAAFKEFITTLGLPNPTAVVGSGGGGFHAHWALEEALPREEWQVLANALSCAATALGMLCDTQCTVDAARILRVPDTLNYKYDEPKPVTLLSHTNNVSIVQIREALAGYIGKISATSVGSAAKGPVFEDGSTAGAAGETSINSDLGGSTADVRVEVKVADVSRNCALIARMMGTGGKDVEQPLWFLAASASAFMEDGRDTLHLMSNQHAGYSARATDDLYDRVSSKRSASNVGWTQCAKFALYGGKECQTCPLLSQNKSPLNFATPITAAMTDASLPDLFSRSPDGLILYRDISEDGVVTTLPICHYPITNGWLSNNPWCFHFDTRTESGRKTIMEIPTEIIFQREGIAKYLGAKGFFCTEKQFKMIKEFFVAWLQKLQGQKDSVISASPFGWSVVDGKVEGFTYAGRVWMDRNDRPAANPNPVLQYQYTPKGDFKVWSESAEIITEQKRPGLDAILAVAFAAPLVRFTGFSGLILNSFSSESGIGKTTVMKISQAVWANPVLAMQGLNDTPNSVLGKMGQIRSLPMYWDEIKSEAQVKRFCGIVFELTGGREKSRMNADTTLRLSGTWQTLLVSASNDSLVDGMAREVGSTTAGLHRLFEFAIPKPAKLSRDIGVVQRLLGKLDDNYGTAGLIYAKFLGAHWQRIEQEVAKLQDELYTEVKVKQEERMWIATIAVLLKGAEYSNELNLTSIGIPELKEFLFEVLEKMRGLVTESPSDLNNDMSVSTILAEFLNSTRARNTLITNRIWVSQGKPPKGSVAITCDQSKLGEIMVQIGKDDQIIRISSTALTRWMGERSYSRQTFTKRLEEEFGLQKVNGKLGGGTELSCAMEHLLELDMNHPKLSKFI